MEFIFDLLHNPFLVISAVAWLSSQIMKVITHAIIYKEWDIKRFFGDGGMPSTHTATVSSLMAFAGIAYGLDSFQFAVCFILTIIICRDAVGVRWETGKQAKIINELRKIIESDETDEIKLKEFVGHNPVQVATGFILGVAVAIIMSFVLQ